MLLQGRILQMGKEDQAGDFSGLYACDGQKRTEIITAVEAVVRAREVGLSLHRSCAWDCAMDD
jgi:hypothetical protein